MQIPVLPKTKKKKQKEKIKEVEGNKSYDSFRKTVA